MSPLYEIALAALTDLYEDTQQSSDRAIFAERPAAAVRLGQQAAVVKSALRLLESLTPHRPLSAQDTERVAS